MDGYILVDKPKGVSSFGVVAKVRGCIRACTGQKVKVGHIGTLDPMATGLLVLVVGKYTKKVPDLIGHNKTYDVELTLGQISSTGDIEGDITDINNTQPAKEQLLSVLNKFVGPQMQTPPAFSAIKVNGQRAYDLARKGKEVKIEPRQIIIHSINLTDYNYPKVHFVCNVSSGTYIRSLAQDIGTALGTGAYMSNLRRTAIDIFDIKNSIQLNNINSQNVTQLLSK
ncbi:tRNA pseudouridine(55) synthase TruB [Candidatus Saccharibacteria bacterium]|nr:tRNA pseudouridine(55) synthase TruB [Candidatus Saccharibacteria bacterium]MDQ5958445.1 tRNA pseudouridine55 synthase [Patescibacteria group bacterium]